MFVPYCKGELRGDGSYSKGDSDSKGELSAAPCCNIELGELSSEE